ncbi:hypothetical protein [Streptomyces sp. NPDC002676]
MIEEPRKSIDGVRLVAGGFDGFTQLDWIREVGASVTGALAAWDQGELVEAPVGKWLLSFRS